MDKKFKTIVLSILGGFLAISLVACSFLYVNSMRTIHTANVLNQASLEVTSIAETLKSTNGKLETTAKLLRGHSSYDLTDSTITFYYDADMELSSKSTATYATSVSKSTFDDYHSYVIRVYRINDKADIYKLEFKTVRERK
jgi:hypothetical protein